MQTREAHAIGRAKTNTVGRYRVPCGALYTSRLGIVVGEKIFGADHEPLLGAPEFLEDANEDEVEIFWETWEGAL